ncbi:MAG: sugar O-acetyltransferase [Acuticoccus sp.]
MPRSERHKMMAGEWYTCINGELEALRNAARAAVLDHARMDPLARGAMAPSLRALLGQVGPDVYLEAPFHCTYGFNIVLGAGVYFNAGCVVLDTARVRVGEGAMFGPAVQIYCADHHRDPKLRAAGMEIAHPVDIGANVWVGGGAIILPGVSIGDDAIIGAGSVVTRNVAAGTTVTGNPARAQPRG